MDSIYEHLHRLQTQGIPAVMATVVAKWGEGPAEAGKKMILAENGEAYGTVGGGALEFQARELCKTLLKERRHHKERYVLKEGAVVVDSTTLPMACGGVIEIFYEYLGALEYVYLFGAGHVAKATGKILKTMPFHVTVIDDRKEVLDDFGLADQAYCEPFAEFIDNHGIREDAIVIVSTPSHKYDYHVINKILEKKIKVKYVGMLCSLAKLKEYLAKTKEAFGPSVDLSNFYAPIGLELGGGSPAEIAVSIVSEVLCIHHGKTTLRHMRETADGDLRYW
jgi:xanthine dehydrogenase accessory factor